MDKNLKVAEQPEIFLVGVVHGDPDGYEKARRLLNRIRPQTISVEISEYSWQVRRRQEPRWQRRFQRGVESLPRQQRKHPALQRVAAQIAYPFEVRAAEDYAQRHGVLWQAVDINAVAREHLPRYREELLSSQNLRNLALTPESDWGEYILQEYRRARRALGKDQGRGIGIGDTEVSPQEAMREKVLAQRVRRLAQKWLRVVHFGGWEHLLTLGQRKTMADFLTAWRPQRLLLDELEAL
jgi:hypothetical protein